MKTRQWLLADHPRDQPLRDGHDAGRAGELLQPGVPPGDHVRLHRARLGEIVLDWASEFPSLRKRLAALVNDGRLVFRVDEQQGFENTPRTLMRLFTGENRGKQVLKIAD